MLTAGFALPAAADADVFALDTPGTEVSADAAYDDDSVAAGTYGQSADSFGEGLTDEEDTFGNPDADASQGETADPDAAGNSGSWETYGDDAGSVTDPVTDETADTFGNEDSVAESAAGAKAAEDKKTDTATQTTETKKVTLAKKVVIDDLTFVFKQKVIKKSRYGATRTPRDLYVKGYKTKITATWKAPEKKVDGYYVFRQDTEGTEWNQVADLPATKTTYKDATAKYEDNVFTYRIIAYKNTEDGIKVSHPSDWASAVTTRSKKANVYSVTNNNHAKTAALSIGKTVKVSLTFPKNYLTKKMRWSTSDETIATVDENGKIKGIAHGKVKVYGKMHTGNVYSFDISIVEPGTARGMVEVMAAWMDYSRLNGKQEGIIDIYNSQDPLPVGYKMKYYDAWCDATVTAAAIVSGNYKKIGGECSVPRHINIFKSKKIWEEDGTIKPKKGDLIIYNWNKSYQPNNTNASHIGIVESVKNGQITTIEGNMGSGVVGRRVIKIGYGYIRGFAQPKYKK
jgi:hypothetical protein